MILFEDDVPSSRAGLEAKNTDVRYKYSHLPKTVLVSVVPKQLSIAPLHRSALLWSVS